MWVQAVGEGGVAAAGAPGADGGGQGAAEPASTTSFLARVMPV